MVSEDKLGKYSHGLASCGWKDVWRESVGKPEPSGGGARGAAGKTQGRGGGTWAPAPPSPHA